MAIDYNHGKELSSIDFKNLIGGPLVAVVEAQAQAALSTVNFIKEIGFKPGTKDPDTGDVQPSGEPVYVSFKYPKEVSPFEPAREATFTLSLESGGKNYVNPQVNITGGSGTGASATVTVGENGTITSINLTNAGTGYTTPPQVTITDPSAPDGLEAASVTVTKIDRIEAKAAVFQEMKLEVPMLTIVPIPYLRVEEVTIDFNAKINSMQTYEAGRSLGVDTTSEVKAKGGFLFGSASASFKCSTSYKSSSKETGSVERTYSMAVHVRAVSDEMPGGMEKILGILEDAIKSQPVSAPAAQIV